MSKPKVWAVINQKGGVGKTTTTVNLAYYLAKAGKKVLLVDLDPQGNASSGVGVSIRSIKLSLYDCLAEAKDPKDCIVASEWEGLSLLPASTRLAALDTELPSTMRDRVLKLKQTLAKLDDEQWDIILIDAPPSLGLLTVNALVASDSVILPVQAEYYALEGLGQLLETMQIVRTGLNKTLGIMGILVTMYDGRTSLGRQVQQQLRTHFAKYLFETSIPRNIKLAEAPSHGKPIGVYAPACSGAKAYAALTKEVLKHV
ncbi:MAG: chromosome partitioning protein [Patescibacteria group bacterium]|nr:chromosome partitioning protein [Patescibacteria group bacterium]